MSNVIELKMSPPSVTKTAPDNKRRLKTVARYKALVSAKSHKWTETEVRGLYRLLNSLSYDKTKRDDKLYSALRDLQDRAIDGAFIHSITEAQTEKGIEWLRRNFLKLDGSPRKCVNNLCYFNGGHLDGSLVVHVIKNFKAFKFIGVLVQSNGYWEAHTPVYRTIAKDGSYFDYSPAHWAQPNFTATRDKRRGA
jgi:hypothetical protein